MVPCTIHNFNHVLVQFSCTYFKYLTESSHRGNLLLYINIRRSVNRLYILLFRLLFNDYTLIQDATWLLADFNLAQSGLRWLEKGGVGIIGKGTSWSFVVEGYFSNARTKTQKQWPVHNAEASHVLLIHATGNVEMGLVAKKHKRGRRHDLQERFTSCLASVKITFSDLLHYCHFVWMKTKFFVKDSSHSAIRLFKVCSIGCYTFFPSFGQFENTTPVRSFPFCRESFN